MAEATQQPPAPDDVSVVRLVVILGSAAFASTVSMRLVDPLVPLIADSLARSIVEVALLSSVFTLSYAAGQPVLGPVADVLGKTRVIAACLVVLALTSLAAALAPGYWTLAVARGLSGLFAGGIIPVAMAAIGDRVAMGQRQVALSRFLVALTIGQVMGSTLSGLLGALVGWRGVFLFGSTVAILGATSVVLLLKPRPPATRERLSPSVVMARYRDVLANPRALPLFALTIAEGMSVFGVFPYVADILQDRGAESSAQAGLALAPFGLGGLFYAAVAPWLVARIGPRRMALIGGAIIFASLAFFSVPLHWTSAPALFAVFGFGFYLVHTSFQTQATELSGTARSSGVALFACTLFIGTAMGPPAMAMLMHTFGLEAALVVSGLASFATGAIAGVWLDLSGPHHRPR